MPHSARAVTDDSLGDALVRFHRALADVDEPLPDYLENVERARSALEQNDAAPALEQADRRFLVAVAEEIRGSLGDADVSRHPLHGDPHLDGNVIVSDAGPVLIDFEAACRGPYEWDLTALPRAAHAYPDVDVDLLSVLTRMRSLVVATWCWLQYGRAPEVDEAAHVHLNLLRRPDDFEGRVVAAIRALRPGEVASYGEIAQEAGFPRAARAVGRVLATTEGLPWWRVVRADGRLASPHPQEQARRLAREGVPVVGGRVVRTS